jgi:hypothetical protein
MSAPQRWDYKTVDIKPGFLGMKMDEVQNELDKHGKQGWELVSVAPLAARASLVLFFKRPA